jgi:5,10-methylenetetrahydromethanopterin reductase
MAVSFGFSVILVDKPNDFIKLAEFVDHSGFDYMWITDSSLHGKYCYCYMTLMATHTKRIKIGPACTHPHTRHPAVSMSAIASVDEISDGRAIMNIGVGADPVIELGFKPAKVAIVREMVETCRRLLTEEKVNYAGQAWTLHDATLRFKTRKDIPIYITASGPKMLELAGEVADGVLFLPGTLPEAVKFAMSHIEIGARKVGRSMKDIDAAWCAIGSVDHDRKRALDASRYLGAWLTTAVPGYAKLVGVSSEFTQRVRDAYAGGHFTEAQAAAALISDDLLQKIALAGTPEEVRARVKSVVELGVNHVEFMEIGSDRMRGAKLFAEEVLPHFK